MTIFKAVTHFYLPKTLNWFWKKCFSVHEISLYEKSALFMRCLWNVISMNFFFYEMAYLWNFRFFQCHSMKCPNSKYILRQHDREVKIEWYLTFNFHLRVQYLDISFEVAWTGPLSVTNLTTINCTLSPHSKFRVQSVIFIFVLLGC